jgi:hypothetical protein
MNKDSAGNNQLNPLDIMKPGFIRSGTINS